MKKFTNLLKKYRFYVATGAICIGAVAAIFLVPSKGGNVKSEANPYAQNQLTDANDLNELTNDTVVEEDELDTTDEGDTAVEQSVNDDNAVNDSEAKVDEVAPNTSLSNADNNEVAKETNLKEVSREDSASNQVEEEEVKTETFKSTTATSEEPFFAEGDTFEWPVEGDVVVPYTDESTKHWFSESLNQTMRTFGICISANEGAEVKAVAKGTVTKVVDDSSEYLEAGMPYVGKLMVIDHGNGYVSMYGFQGGQVNEELVGTVVNAGDVLGSIGSPKGAFISAGDNIYLQVIHNDEVVNPLNYLDLSNQQVKAEGVDLGYAE